MLPAGGRQHRGLIKMNINDDGGGGGDDDDDDGDDDAEEKKKMMTSKMKEEYDSTLHYTCSQKGVVKQRKNR